MAGNINQLRNLNATFKRSVLSKNNQQNLHLIAELRRSQDGQQRQLYLDQQGKWDRFRLERKYYIELYLKLRRKQKMVEEILRLVMTRQAMSQVHEAYEESKLEKLRIQRQIFLNFKFSIVWRRRAKKWGGGLWDIHRGRIRRTLRLTHQAMSAGRQEEAKAVLHPFLKANADHEKTRVRVRYFFDRIVFMQNRMRDKLICKDSKVEVLINYWDKMQFQIMAGAAPNAAKGRPMDEEARTFAMKLHRVPEEVRLALLSAYVQACRRLHAICFLQWRRMYPSSVRHEPQHIDALLARGVEAAKATVNTNQKVKDELLPEMALPYPEFKKRYKL